MTDQSLCVEYVHEVPKLHTGNILWKPPHPMRNGKFPKTHPCAAGDTFEMEMGKQPAIEAFRSRGYWASCFPEGDGITMTCSNNQPAEQVAKDIEECFGWKVTVRK